MKSVCCNLRVVGLHASSPDFHREKVVASV